MSVSIFFKMYPNARCVYQAADRMFLEHAKDQAFEYAARLGVEVLCIWKNGQIDEMTTEEE